MKVECATRMGTMLAGRGPTRNAALQRSLATRIGFAVDGWFLIIGSLVRGYTG